MKGFYSEPLSYCPFRRCIGLKSSPRMRTPPRKHKGRRTRLEPSPRVLRWSVHNHRAATGPRRCARSRLAQATMHCVPACKATEVDVACVVRSVARGSLFDGALADILTSAGPSPTQSTLSQAHSRDASTRLRLFSICGRSTRIRSARLVEATHDSWPAPTCIDVQHVGMLRGRRHWRPAASQHVRSRVHVLLNADTRKGLDASEPLP